MLVDSPIIHYANFLISQGVAPYRELQENNLPGAYLTEWFGMHVFGGGDLAWRFFEFFQLLLSTACMIWIARPYDWTAGLFVGCVFAIYHGAEGPEFSGEREIAMTCLMLCGYVALFLAQRRGRAAWMLPMGFCFAFAASIKPTVAPLPLILLAWTLWSRRRKGQPWTAWLAWAFAGMLLPVALVLGYLQYHHAFTAFIELQRSITTYYARVTVYTMPEMLRALFESHLLDEVVAVALLVRLRPNRLAWTQEQWMLLLGAGFGVLSFLLQRKNFNHHRYIFVEFILLLAGIELMQTLRARSGMLRWIAAAFALFLAVRFVPAGVLSTKAFRPDSSLVEEMVADFRQLGGSAALQRRVVCLDQAYGCLTAVYQLRIVENAALSGDMLLFANSNAPVIHSARAWFWQAQQSHPADLVVVTNQNFLSSRDSGNHNDFSRLARWPQYDALLHSGYRLLTERSFPCEKGYRARSEHRYRIYARVGSDLAGMQLPAQPMETCPAAVYP